MKPRSVRSTLAEFLGGPLDGDRFPVARGCTELSIAIDGEKVYLSAMRPGLTAHLYRVDPERPCARSGRVAFRYGRV